MMELPPDGSSTSNVFGYILLLVVLVFINAFFAMSELAIVSLNDNKVRRMAQTGDKKAVKLLRLIDEPTHFLSTIQIGVTLSGFLASAVAADTFAEMIVSAFKDSLAISPSLLRGIAVVIITLLLSYVTLVFGELVPKRIAMQNYEKISFSVVGILTVLMAAFKPLVWLVSKSTNGILRLIGIDPNQKPEEVTEEEIRMMLDVGNETGNIEESEKDMIYNIFEFDNRRVDDIMAHRTEIVALEYKQPLEEIVKVALETGYSRIPVYKDDLDNIVGILYAKDLLVFYNSDSIVFQIDDFLRDPLFVIESTVLRNLLTLFQETKIQLAIVADEYGGTAGLVSMEDLLESIVGNIQDEYDDEEEEIVAISDTEFLVNGLTDFEDVIDFFHLNVTKEEEAYFDTIGGYIVSQIGQIPAEGDVPIVMVDDIKFQIKQMNERRVATLTVTLPPPPPPAEENGKERKGFLGKDKNKEQDSSED